jgi:hypothetical protein
MVQRFKGNVCLTQQPVKTANRRISNVVYQISKGGIARAAQALAPRVAQFFFKTAGVHGFDVRCSYISFSIKAAFLRLRQG